jgi:pimeloyl-ACP methyl ester carboxylesterase
VHFELTSRRVAGLIGVGEHDQVTTPRAATVLYQGIAESELHVVAGAGHMSYVEEQEEYLRAVCAFFGRAAAGK